MRYKDVGSLLEDRLRSSGIHEGYFGLLRKAISDFIANESEYNAKAVYEFFLAIYRQSGSDGSPLADMMDVMHDYEVKASVLTEHQRDHYIHSVNVFILGMYLYESNEAVREAFDKVNGKGTFGSPEESFLFSWGNAALFHDIGYPVEIATNQIKTFMRTVADADGGRSKAKVRIDVLPRDDLFVVQTGPDEGQSSRIRADEFLSAAICKKIGKCTEDMDSIVLGYYERMRDELFIDHGFFSAIILLKSYATLLQSARMDRERFDTEVADSASAILLHNLYPNVLSKERSFGKLGVGDHPTGYLLILCDALQEWNREGYGYKTRGAVRPKASGVVSENGMLRLNYRTVDACMDDGFGSDKEQEIRGYLDVDGVFPSGLRVTCSCDNPTDVFLRGINRRTSSVLPRPVLDNIIMVAKGIHEDYNRQRLK